MRYIYALALCQPCFLAKGRAEKVDSLLFLSDELVISYRRNTTPIRAPIITHPMKKRRTRAQRHSNVRDCLVCGARYFATKSSTKTCGLDCAHALKKR